MAVRQIMISLVTIALVASLGQEASAQTRKDVGFSSVGQMRSTVSTGFMNTFNNNSYGVGNLQQSRSPLTFTGVLNSSVGSNNVGGPSPISSMVGRSTALNTMMSRPLGNNGLMSQPITNQVNPNYTGANGFALGTLGTKPIAPPPGTVNASVSALGLTSGISGLGGSKSGLSGSTTGFNNSLAELSGSKTSANANTPAQSGSKRYETQGQAIADTDPNNMVSKEKGATGAVNAYLDALGGSDNRMKSGEDNAITTLVPSEDQPSKYRDFMLQGDLSFRRGDFVDAERQFRLANDIGGNDPESLLCMAHTQFAMARYSYSSAAYYLRQALKFFPEMPLAPLRPKGFFGDPASYADRVMRLEDFANRTRDADAYLMLAYFRWYSDDTDAARNALAAALGFSSDPETTEAIETFWDGMTASGKVSGTLMPTTQPAAGSVASKAPAATPATNPAETSANSVHRQSTH
jgi:hypothetical protein